jgi:hypothetical protein
MRVANFVAVLMSAGALMACGSKGPGATGGASASAAKAPEGNATAEEVAEEARDGLDCPAKIKTAARDPQAPVDDVQGVRPGLTYEEAANVVLCTHDLLVVQADGRGFQLPANGKDIRQGFSARFAEPRVVKSSEDYMREMNEEFMARSGNAVRQDMKPGQAKWYVGTIGMPGQERVINAAREEWFEEGRQPTIASVEQALVKKYGNPTRRQHPGGGSAVLTWSYDPMGRQVTETSALYNSCSGAASPDGGANFSPDCGIVVMAIAYPLRDNPELAQMMQVGVVDQATGYESLQNVEQALNQQETERRAAQVKDAEKNADVPDL